MAKSSQAVAGKQLSRGLKNRHIQLIALGGAIGTGLFLGVAQTIQLAGPSILLGYAIGGGIAFLILRQLGEMVVEEPVAGSFSYFAYKYWGDFAGFASGWNYWVLYLLAAMAELTAVGIYIQEWFPHIPTWVSAAVCFILVNAINLTQVRIYGELEFCFAIIKIIAIVGMILFGLWLLMSGQGGTESSITNLWTQGGFFPHGLSGLIMAMAFIMFSFGGLEMVGVTAAEAENPKLSIPKATNQVIYRILIFYIGSLAVLLSLYPWQKMVEGRSPFVLIFDALGNAAVANVLNVVLLTAAISVYNSCVYSNSRMLFGLSKQNNAPKLLQRLNSQGVPAWAVVMTAGATALCVVINYVIPERAFSLLMSLVVSSLVINWLMISLTHLKFRQQQKKQGIAVGFPSIGYPWANYVCLLFLCAILLIMYMTPASRISVILIPIWVFVLWLGFLIKKRVSMNANFAQAED